MILIVSGAPVSEREGATPLQAQVREIPRTGWNLQWHLDINRVLVAVGANRQERSARENGDKRPMALGKIRTFI